MDNTGSQYSAEYYRELEEKIKARMERQQQGQSVDDTIRQYKERFYGTEETPHAQTTWTGVVLDQAGNVESGTSQNEAIEKVKKALRTMIQYWNTDTIQQKEERLEALKEFVAQHRDIING